MQIKHFYTSPLLPSAVQNDISCGFFAYCAFIYVIVVLVASFSSPLVHHTHLVPTVWELHFHLA